jgi:heme/copper-type cytochrome/quinol oxidase subunit 2
MGDIKMFRDQVRSGSIAHTSIAGLQHLMHPQTTNSNRILRSLGGFVVVLAALAMPHLGLAQSSSQQEALDLLMSSQNDRAPLVITVTMENGMYALRYDMQNGLSACPIGGDLVVPLGIATEVNVTSNDNIIRWVIPEADFH